MQLNNFIFSNKPFSRILRHILFWLGWYMYIVVLFLYSNSNVQITFWQTLIVRCGKLLKVLPISAVQCYIIVYWLIPKLIKQKKYLLFIAGLLVTTAGVNFFVDIATINNLNFASIWRGFMSYINRGNPEVCLAFVVIKISKTWYLREREKEILIKENVSAELQLLKAQIHPHFLFNTLNNIYFFSLNNVQQAKATVKKLKDLMQYIIEDCEQSLMPLDKEIKMINDYINLEMVRYGNNFTIDIKTVTDENKMIAPLLMIPFVENSFKHGASKMLDNPWIKLSIEVKANTLYFYLANNKPAENYNNDKKGIGLTNVKKRLQLLYPHEHSLRIDSTENSFIIEMQVPLQNGIANESKIVTKQLISEPA